MTYKTNFEPYVSNSLDIRRVRTSEGVLYPLMDLYPHVAALQLQADSTAFPTLDCFSGYQNVGYWADAYTTQSPEDEESKPGSRRSSESTTGRFVSKIRRFLGRDDMRRRAHSP